MRKYSGEKAADNVASDDSADTTVRFAQGGETVEFDGGKNFGWDFGSGQADAAERSSAPPGEWMDVRVEKFVDPLRSPTLTRVLYIPGLSEKRNVYVDYKLKVLRSPPGRAEEDDA